MQHPIYFDGSDPDFLHFGTPSFTTVGKEYSLTISKRTGELRCDCTGAICHGYNHAQWDDFEAASCRHQRVLRAYLKDHFAGLL